MSLSQRVIAVSERTRQDIIKNHGVPGSKVVVAYNGVDTEEFRPVPRQPSILRKYGLGAEMLILSVGAVQPRKGQMRMVECMPKILSAWPGATYVNVGPTYDVAFTNSVLDRARQLGVSDAVRLLAGVPQEDLVALISAADLCVHPSSREPFGLAVVEEMACAKPVVALDSGALPEIIDNMVDGVIVDSMGRTLGDSILAILSDPALMRRMGAAARDKVTDKFTWDKTASRLEEIYRGLRQ